MLCFILLQAVVAGGQAAAMEVEEEEGSGKRHSAAADREGERLQHGSTAGAGAGAAAGMQPGPAPPCAAPQQPWSCRSYIGVRQQEGNGRFTLHMDLCFRGSRCSLNRSGYATREDAAAARDIAFLWNCHRSGGTGCMHTLSGCS